METAEGVAFYFFSPLVDVASKTVLEEWASPVPGGCALLKNATAIRGCLEKLRTRHGSKEEGVSRKKLQDY